MEYQQLLSKKSPRSCIACRKSRVGCSKDLPTCFICKKRGIECVYKPLESKIQKPSKITKRRIPSFGLNSPGKNVKYHVQGKFVNYFSGQSTSSEDQNTQSDENDEEMQNNSEDEENCFQVQQQIANNAFDYDTMTMYSVLNNWLCMSHITDNFFSKYIVNLDVVSKEQMYETLDKICSNLFSNNNAIEGGKIDGSDLKNVLSVDIDLSCSNLSLVSIFVYGLHKQGYCKYARKIHDEYFVPLYLEYFKDFYFKAMNLKTLTEQDMQVIAKRASNLLFSVNMELSFLFSEPDSVSQVQAQHIFDSSMNLSSFIEDFIQHCKPSIPKTIELINILRKNNSGNKCLNEFNRLLLSNYSYEYTIEPISLLLLSNSRFYTEDTKKKIQFMLNYSSQINNQELFNEFCKILYIVMIETERTRTLDYNQHSSTYYIASVILAICLFTLIILKRFKISEIQKVKNVNNQEQHKLALLEVYKEVYDLNCQYVKLLNESDNGSLVIATVRPLLFSLKYFVEVYEKKKGSRNCECIEEQLIVSHIDINTVMTYLKMAYTVILKNQRYFNVLKAENEYSIKANQILNPSNYSREMNILN